MEFFIILAMASVVIFIGLKKAGSLKKQWPVVAQQLGLEYVPGRFGAFGTITGRMDGHSVEVSTYSTGGTDARRVYTEYNVTYRKPFPVNFRVSAAGALHKMGKIIGFKDIAVGDIDFDGQVKLSGNDPQSILKILSPEFREVVKRMITSHPKITIDEKQVCILNRGRDNDPALMVDIVRQLLSFCKAVDRTVDGV